jgi:feruloyl esterase
VNNIVNPVNTTRYISLSSWTSINSEILSQCDGKDGLVDGLLVRPGECALSYPKFTCGTASERFNSSTCLTNEQVGTLQKIFSDWKDPATGKVIFQGYEVSSAFQGGAGQTLTGRYVE